MNGEEMPRRRATDQQRTVTLTPLGCSTCGKTTTHVSAGKPPYRVGLLLAIYGTERWRCTQCSTLRY